MFFYVGMTNVTGSFPYWNESTSSRCDQHRSILNLDLESTERDPIYLCVSYFYLKFLNVHKKLHLKHFYSFNGKFGLTHLLITFHLVLLFGELILD